MRLNKILVSLGTLFALGAGVPAFAWGGGWDWDEDVAPSAGTLDAELDAQQLDALSDPLCAESLDGDCQIHA